MGSSVTQLRAARARRSPSDSRAGRESIGDGALVEAALEGDRWAEDALVRRHGREVERLIARLLGTHQGVHDLAQDTFLAAFERLATLREPAVFRGWLLRIAVLKVRRAIRRRKLLRRLGLDQSVPDATLEALASQGAGPEVRLELATLDAVLAALPANQRVAWMLRYVEGHTVRDCGRLCGCSLRTIKRRIAAANRQVRAAVDEEVIGRGW